MSPLLYALCSKLHSETGFVISLLIVYDYQAYALITSTN